MTIKQKRHCMIEGCNYPEGQCSGACWSDDEARMDIIGQNGNDGDHYDAVHAAVDMINHPPHYTAHASGVECIEITEHLGFCLGNAIKYCFRAGHKKSSGETEDVNKAIWYVERELARLSARQEVRGKHDRQGEEHENRQDKETCSDKEWIYDVAFFFAENTSLHSRDGFGDVRLSAPTWFGRVTFERGPKRQPFGQSDVGIRFGKYPTQERAHDRTAGGPALVGKADPRECVADQEWQPFAIEDGKNVRGVADTSEPHTSWRKLAAFISAEENKNKAAAIFYLATAKDESALKKAIWYLKKLREVL